MNLIQNSETVFESEKGRIEFGYSRFHKSKVYRSTTPNGVSRIFLSYTEAYSHIREFGK